MNEYRFHKQNYPHQTNCAMHVLVVKYTCLYGKHHSEFKYTHTTNYSFITYFVKSAMYSQQNTEHLIMVITLL